MASLTYSLKHEGKIQSSKLGQQDIIPKFPSNSFYSSQAHVTRKVHLTGLKACLLEFYLTYVVVQQWENLVFGESSRLWHVTIQ